MCHHPLRRGVNERYRQLVVAESFMDHCIVKIVSLNVGEPREVQRQGKIVSTGIFKEPVKNRVMMRRLNLDGDRQADLTVHGGINKAVYAYPSEHYPYWRAELPG